MEDLEIISVILLLMPSWVLPICLSWHVIKKPLGCVQIIHCTYCFKYFLGFQFDRQLAVVRTDFFFLRRNAWKSSNYFFSQDLVIYMKRYVINRNTPSRITYKQKIPKSPWVWSAKAVVRWGVVAASVLSRATWHVLLKTVFMTAGIWLLFQSCTIKSLQGLVFHWQMAQLNDSLDGGLCTRQTTWLGYLDENRH